MTPEEKEAKRKEKVKRKDLSQKDIEERRALRIEAGKKEKSRIEEKEKRK